MTFNSGRMHFTMITGVLADVVLWKTKGWTGKELLNSYDSARLNFEEGCSEK